jgi:phospholipase A1
MYNFGSIILINKDCKLSSPIAKFFISVFVTASIVTGASAQTEKETAPSPLVQEQDIELEKVISTEQNETIEATKDSLDNTLLDEKIDNEREANRNLYSLVQHRQNYLLPISYSTGPNPITLDGAGAEQVDRFEAKYQISVKTPLWLQEDDVSGAYFGFTAVSFWQLYNDETSKPFRETNYEPEIFYQFSSDLTLLGYKYV